MSHGSVNPINIVNWAPDYSRREKTTEQETLPHDGDTNVEAETFRTESQGWIISQTGIRGCSQQGAPLVVRLARCHADEKLLRVTSRDAKNTYIVSGDE